MDYTESSKLKLSLELLVYLYNKQSLVKGSKIAEDFKMSDRGVRRLISDLRDVGYDIESISGPYGGYRLNRSRVLLPVRLSDLEKKHWQNINTTIQASDISDKDEAINLLKIISIQSQLETSFTPDIYTTKRLRTEVKDKIDNISSTLQTAMGENRRVEIKYLNSEWREFRPHQFQYFNNIPYIKGYYDSSSNSFRTLRLSRFDDVRLISKKYTRNENFDKDNDQSAFSKNIYKSYHVVLKVYNKTDILDYEYGENQKIETYSDYHILSFDLEGDQIIKELVLSLGKDVELLEPRSLRDSLKNDLEVLYLRYQ